MKEKINQFAGGIFTYRQPGMILSEEKLVLKASAGSCSRGSFEISNENGAFMKGIIYLPYGHMSVPKPEFLGERCTVSYEFDASFLSGGAVEKGSFTIVSSIGEAELPYEVTVEEASVYAGGHRMSDLFQFTNLAKSSPAEAAAVFLSSEFEAVFLKDKPEERMIYRSVVKGPDHSLAMEEFLTAVRKKVPVTISVEETELEFHIAGRSMQETLVIRREGWGHLDVTVTSDSPILLPETGHLEADHFAGNTCELPFVLDADKMRSGRNFATLLIRTPQQEISVHITVMCAKRGRPFPSGDYKKKAYMVKLTNNYMKFRLKKLNAEQYATSTKAVLYGFRAISQDRLLDLMAVHLSIVTGKKKEAEEQLQSLEEKLPQEEPVVQAVFLYLKAMHREEPAVISEAAEKIAEWASVNPKDWRFAWLLFYTDSRYDKHPEQKLELIRQLFLEGCTSPVIYLEAAAVLGAEPQLLHKLEPLEIQVMHWAVRNGVYTKKLILRFAYLAGMLKNYHGLIFLTLTELYQKEKERDVLAAVCSILIKGHRTDTRFFKWYEQGVESGLKLTQLHEYYMFSVDENREGPLAPPIYLYFSHANDLPDKKKAFLYAKVIAEKEEKHSCYPAYEDQFREFAQQQLKEGCQSEYLARIYAEVFRPECLTEEWCGYFPEVMFKHLIICRNPHIKGIAVVHRELMEEQYVPMENGRAYVDIYTETAGIYLVDGNGCRYALTIPYEVRQLMNPSVFLESGLLQESTDFRILLYLMAMAAKYQKYKLDLLELRKQLLESSWLSVEYRTEILLGIVRHYYDFFNADLLETYLRRVEIDSLPAFARAEMMDLMLVRGMSELVMPALRRYGPAGISEKHLLRFVSERVNEPVEAGGYAFLLGLCAYLFTEGKYDPVTLSCLAEFYDGPPGVLFQIWQAASDLGARTVRLEESILTQSLFAEQIFLQLTDVFLAYEKEGEDKKLMRAFLSYMAYRYLVSDTDIRPELIDGMKKEALHGEVEVCNMALLKYLSCQKKLTDEEKEYAGYQLYRVFKSGTVLPFMKAFVGKCDVPYELLDKQYVFFTAEPDSKVEIHYRLLGEKLEHEEFRAERMRNVCFGIFAKEFLLFYGEEIQYYISEEYGGKTELLESMTLTLDNRQETEDESCYHMLNLMLIAREMQDEATLRELMEQYIKQKHAAEKLFRQE